MVNRFFKWNLQNAMLNLPCFRSLSFFIIPCFALCFNPVRHGYFVYRYYFLNTLVALEEGLCCILGVLEKEMQRTDRVLGPVPLYPNSYHSLYIMAILAKIHLPLASLMDHLANTAYILNYQ